MKQLLIYLSIIVTLILSVALIYSPGLSGPYVLDDEENITSNKAVAIKEITLDSVYNALLSNQSGPFKRPLAALSFSLNHYFAGGFDNTLPFKLTNVTIHIINSLLIYYLSLLLIRRPAFANALTGKQQLQVAGFAALFWALHPIQLTSVLYIVQRMNSLSALFVISGLIAFIHGRGLLERGNKYGFLVMVAGTVGGVLLGIGAKENAVLLPLIALIIEWTLYQRDHLAASTRKWLVTFYLLTILVPLTIFIIYSVAHPGFLLDSYAMRPFSLYERLLTETRVLWFYLSLLLLPSIQRLGLFHDDISISTGLLHPLSTLPAVMGILAILVFALLKSRRYPVACFAILWYLAGHSLESSIFGLEIAYEHRNYLPSFGVTFAFAYTIIHFLSRMKIEKSGIIIAALPYSIILVFAFSTWTWANTWKDTMSLVMHHVTNHPKSSRANNYAANAYVREKGDFIGAIKYTINGMRLSPNEAGFYLDMQLFLAYLASEINTDLVKKHINTRGKELQISALPDSIKVENINGNIKLLHNPSNPSAITKLLRNKPISVHGVVALEKLTKCIIDHNAYCHSLRRDAVVWLDSAAGNPRTTTEYRALISSDAAKLHANLGEFERALAYITSATKLSPGTVYYELGKAEYLIKLGRLDDADTLLSRIEKSETSLKNNLETIKLLRKMHVDASKNRG